MLLNFLVVALAAPPSWQLTLDRAVTVGYEYSLKAEGTQSITMKDKDGKVLEERVLSATLSGSARVTKIDKQGIATELSLQVDKLDIVIDGEAGTPIVNERVAVKRVDGHEVFEASYGALKGPARRALSLLVSVQPPDAPRTDDAFPPGKPRKLGDSWPLDAEKMVEWMKQHGTVTEPKYVEGKATLKGLKPCGVKETCLEVGFEFTVKNARPVVKPVGMEWEGANGRTELTGLLPLDPRSPRRAEIQDDLMTARVIVDREPRSILYKRKVSRQMLPLTK